MLKLAIEDDYPRWEAKNVPHPSLSHVFPLHSPMSTTCVRIKPLHPEISIHILHTVLSAFWEVLTRRICLTVKSFFCRWPFSLFSWPQCEIQRWYCKEKLDASQMLEGKRLILINPSRWRGKLRVKFFPTKNKTSNIHPKLWMWSDSKHFTCSCLSRFKIKSFCFANSVEFVSFKTCTINYTDTCRQYSPASCWLVFQNIDCCLFSASHRPSIAVLRVIRQKDLACNPGQVK